MMNFKAGLLQSLDDLEPLRPDRINQDIDFVSLNQERSVSNPGDANFALPNLRKLRHRMITSAPSKERNDEDAGQQMALVPVRRRAQSHARGRVATLTV